MTAPAAAHASALVTPEPDAVSSAESASSVTSPAASGSAAAVAGTSSGSVVVDVVGKVRRPGIATLPSGSRVVDALHAVGGARRGVSLASLNLARLLVDGEQIVVGLRTPPGIAASLAAGSDAAGASAPSSGASSVPMVNINTADQTLLEQLPGVGPVTAKSILDFRAEKGSFSAVDELLEVSGIGDKTLAKIAPYCTV
jgi:competence protein ComEA